MEDSEIVQQNGSIEKSTVIDTKEVSRDMSNEIVTNGDALSNSEEINVNVEVHRADDEILTESHAVTDNDSENHESVDFQLGQESNINNEPVAVIPSAPEVIEVIEPTATTDVFNEPIDEETVLEEVVRTVEIVDEPIQEPSFEEKLVELEPVVEPEPEPIQTEVKTVTSITNGVSSKPIKVLEVSDNGTVTINSHYLNIIDDAVKNNGFHPGYSIDIEKGSNHGQGVMADMIRIVVTGAQTIDGKTCSSVTKLILKTLPDSPDRQAQFSAISTFEREVLMYTKVLPAFIDFQKYKEIPYELGFYNTPYCYAAVCDTVNNLYVIVLEDLVERGYKMWDKLKPVDYDHMKLGLTRLARFHAISIAMNDQNPEIFKELCKLEDNFYKGLMTEPEKFTPIINFSITHAIESLNNQEEFKIDKIVELQKNIVENFGKWIGPQNTSSFKVINHGDCWINNTMYAYYTDGDPIDVCLYDWQMARYGSPVLDIVYFIFTSTDKKFRDMHYNVMLQLYHKSFVEHYERLGGVKSKFTFQNLQNDLKRFGKYGVVMASILLPIVTAKQDSLPDMDKMVIEMMDNPENLAEWIGELDPKYKTRMSDVIRDAVCLGYM